ncbi:MAG: DUF3040 domain-containing protein [Actinobacteria bacterium]|nr:DUF3040 domain-containing protein [Actinomycetota bacterium]
MPLSEDEQRILQQIEQQLYASDPEFAGEIGRHSVYVHHLRRMKWAAALFVAGITVLVAGLVAETSFLVAFAGFVVMLTAALWFEQNLRRLGRAGMHQLAENLKATSVREYFGSTSQRVRERFRRDED